MKGVVLLTRPSNWQGVRTLAECARRGVSVSAVIVEPKTSGDRLRKLRRFLETNGPADTARKVWYTLVARRRFRRELTRARQSELPRAVGEIAARLGIPLHMVESHNDTRCEGLLRDLSPDLILLAGTRIIKPPIIRQARVGCLNAHTGWLPEYRGVNANLWALLEGGRRGVTVHYVDPGVDTGAILLREELPIISGDTIETIEVRTTDLCARLIIDAIQAIEAGTAVRAPQRAEDGRQYRALSFQKEQEVRRLLKRMAHAHSAGKRAYGNP